MTAPTDTEKLAQALRPAFVTAQSCGPDSKYELVFKFRSLDALQAAHRAVIDFLAEIDCAHESRAQPASWPVELQAVGFNDAAAVIGYMDDIDAEVARITGDEGEDSSLQVLRRMPDYQPAQPAKPDGYAYRYADGFLRFNQGAPVNGGKPIEAIPFYFAPPPAQPASVAGWQPIETAPKDGRPILAWCVHDNAQYADAEHQDDWCGPVVARWTDFNHGGWTWHGHCGQFTHWMPLAAAPQPAKESE